ncbi:MAG: hypothetical protein LBV19_03135 [Streptococcaceae bacterium]|jgi:hypothetical protein|nr:hypothetical protein [Streptococcaceae bacterium]
MESILTITTTIAGIISAFAVIFQAALFFRQTHIMKTQLELQRQDTQAYNIAIWSEDWDYSDNKYIVISNNSQSPIYEVEIIHYFGHELFSNRFVKVIPSGKYRDPEGIHETDGFELCFTDTSGVRWKRDSKGKLEMQPQYKLTGREEIIELDSYRRGKDSGGYLKEVVSQLKEINMSLKKIK